MNVRKLCLRILVSLSASMALALLYASVVQQASVFLDWASRGPPLLSGLNRTQHPLESCSFSVSVPMAVAVSNETAPEAVVVTFLGVASSITVVSLAARQDRRRDMERLRLALGIPREGWKYSDAVGAADRRVRVVMEWVRFVRSTAAATGKYEVARLDENEVERLVNSDEYLSIWDTGPWSSPFEHAATTATGISTSDSDELLGTATGDDDFPTLAEAQRFHQNQNKNHRLLTPARVACWYSHLEVIHRIANDAMPMRRETHVVLEDDVDMEADIERQMGMLWVYLRDVNWDVVFLGHCWSNESHHPALTPPQQTHPPLMLTHALHPSRRPKCTHAYALSRTGARRLLLHLRHPPFAFSRAIDQAFAWLIESGRIGRAYSVVPSLVVQRKVSRSDVFRDGDGDGDGDGGGGVGSGWREELRNGILSRCST